MTTQTTDTIDDVEAWVRSVQPLATQVRDMGDGRYACVARLLYHWTLIVGAIGDEAGYDDRWCYADRFHATAALVTWDGTGDPGMGWHRNPRTGRRRPDGDESREYIEW